MTHLQLYDAALAPRPLRSLVVRLALDPRCFVLDPWLEELRRVEVFLYIADDLRGAYTGWFVDACCGTSISSSDLVACWQWNPTIPKQPSGDLDAIAFLEAWKMLRQRIWRPPMDCAIKALEECSLQIALFTCKAQSRAQKLELVNGSLTRIGTLSSSASRRRSADAGCADAPGKAR